MALDKRGAPSYITRMRLLLRLATLCLSLALLGGVLLHDLTGAKMSLDMAGAASVMDVEPDDICPACTQDADEAIVCDVDCTAPVLSTARASQAEPFDLISSRLAGTGDLHLAEFDPASDPFPPRTSFLS